MMFTRRHAISTLALFLLLVILCQSKPTSYLSKNLVFDQQSDSAWPSQDREFVQNQDQILINNQKAHQNAQNAQNIHESDKEYDLFSHLDSRFNDRLFIKRQSHVIDLSNARFPTRLQGNQPIRDEQQQKHSREHTNSDDSEEMEESNDESSQAEPNTIVKEGSSSISSSEEAFEQLYFEGQSHLLDVATIDLDDYHRNLEYFKQTGRLLKDSKQPPKNDEASLSILAIIVVGSLIGLIFLGAGSYIVMRFKRSSKLKAGILGIRKREKTVSGRELLPTSSCDEGEKLDSEKFSFGGVSANPNWRDEIRLTD